MTATVANELPLDTTWGVHPPEGVGASALRVVGGSLPETGSSNGDDGSP
jgi:hypothetical protein